MASNSISDRTLSADRRTLFESVRRVVVKVGTSSITKHDSDGFDLNRPQIDALVEDIAAIKQAGYEVLLVSSGAIGAGLGRLGFTHRPRKMALLQAAAATGQSRLMYAYERRFRLHHQYVAQVLLTQEDIGDRERYKNASQTLQTLLKHGIIPIINENDTICVNEIRVGDNDTLSALVTNLAQAQLLVILSDVDGLYTADPHRDHQAQLISVVPRITSELWSIAGKAGSELGIGGMGTKLKAAKIVTGAGEMMVMARSGEPRVLQRILKGENLGTLFLSKGPRLSGRKRWIAFGLQPRGKVVVDAGAEEALIRYGRSLLATGIVSVEGDFSFGDAIRCVNEQNHEFARGLTNYDSIRLRRIAGKHSSEIRSILDQEYYDEVIHRDNLVILE